MPKSDPTPDTVALSSAVTADELPLWIHCPEHSASVTIHRPAAQGGPFVMGFGGELLLTQEIVKLHEDRNGDCALLALIDTPSPTGKVLLERGRWPEGRCRYVPGSLAHADARESARQAALRLDDQERRRLSMRSMRCSARCRRPVAPSPGSGAMMSEPTSPKLQTLAFRDAVLVRMFAAGLIRAVPGKASTPNPFSGNGVIEGLPVWLSTHRMQTLDLAGTVDAAAIKAQAAGHDLYGVVHHRRGASASRAHVVMPLSVFMKLIQRLEAGTQ